MSGFVLGEGHPDREVVSVNRSLSVALLDDGEVLTITNWWVDGEECDPKEAVDCLAGPSKSKDKITFSRLT